MRVSRCPECFRPSGPAHVCNQPAPAPSPDRKPWATGRPPRPEGATGARRDSNGTGGTIVLYADDETWAKIVEMCKR